MKKTLTKMQKAFVEKDAESIEKLVVDTDFSKNGSFFVEILCQLLEEDWHIEHEDIVSIFEDIREPKSIDALYKTAQKKQFDYYIRDEDYPLARRCIWALWKIGTEEAIDKIRLLSTFDAEEVQKYAFKQLDRLKN